MNWKAFGVIAVLVMALATTINLLPAVPARRGSTLEQSPASVNTVAALQLRIRDIMSTWRPVAAFAATDSSKPVMASSGNDAKLKAALQKRLLVPNLADLSVGPPSPTPLPGVTQRTITVNGSDGQKFQVELFTGP